MSEARLDCERHPGSKRQDHGIESAINVDVPPIGVKACILEAGDHSGNVVMCPLHCRTTSEGRNYRACSERSERFPKCLDANGATLVAVNRDGLHAQNARGL